MKMIVLLIIVMMVAPLVGSADQTGGKMNVLAIFAHPDDVEILCGGTLLKYREQGHNVFIVLTTSGNTGSSQKMDPVEIGRIREAEMLESAKFYGAQVRFLRNDDERFLDTNETRTQVLDAMRWANPDVIFTHWKGDESPDHRMTSQLVRSMVLSLPGVNQQSSERPCTKKVSVFMADTANGIGFLPELYVDIGGQIETRQRSISCHKSQVSYMNTFGSADLEADRRLLAAFRGRQAGCKYAEGFCPFRIDGYMPNCKILP